MNKYYTVCSIYLPHAEVAYDQLSNLIDQLQSPFVIMGDMNAHGPLWYDNATNSRGAIFERLILEKDIVIMNDGTPTSNIRRPLVPWWNSRCDDVKRERERAEKAMKINNTADTRTRYSLARAMCKQVFNNSRKESWQKYLSGINSRTNINVV